MRLALDDSERVQQIRIGNEKFNNGDYKLALKIFIEMNYIDGIIRVADYLYYDKKEWISALKLYKRAGYQKMIDLLTAKAADVVRILLAEDKKKNEQNKEISETHLKEWKPITLNASDIENLNAGNKK